jgi:hypothetical protein
VANLLSRSAIERLYRSYESISLRTRLYSHYGRRDDAELEALTDKELVSLMLWKKAEVQRSFNSINFIHNSGRKIA